MSIFPKSQSNGEYDIELRDRKGVVWPLKLKGSIRNMQEIPSSPSTMVVSSGGERYGDFEPGHSHIEQRDWSGGRGVEEFDDDNTGFFDSMNAWTWDDGKLYNGPQWHFARGIRSSDSYIQDGSMSWVQLTGSNRVVATSFAASASYSADKAYLWIRRRGTPGTLTFNLYSDSGGSPDAVLKSVTKTIADITDYVSVMQVFDWTGTQALTSGTTYWVGVVGDSTDFSACHWEVGVDSATSSAKTSANGSTWATGAFKLYYRVVDADVSRRWWFFELEGALYKVCRYSDTTASKLYLNGARGTATSGGASTITNTGASFGTDSKYVGAKIKIIGGTGNGQSRTILSHTGTVISVTSNWDIQPDNTSRYVVYATPYWTEVSTTGLGKVTSRPCVAGKYAFFPQGSGTNIRTMRVNGTAHEFADDGTNKADLMYLFYSGGVPKIYRAQNDLTDVTVSNASIPAWGASATYSTNVSVGTPDQLITNFLDVNGALWVFKEDSIWVDQGSSTFSRLNLGLSYCASEKNGMAVMTQGLVVHFSWLDSLNYYKDNNATDYGPWRLGGLPAGRVGNISSMSAILSWVVCGVDGHDGTSSVLLNNDVTGAAGGWHEIVRGFEAGKRIQDIYYQSNKDAGGYLWIDIGGDVIYVEFPYLTFNPLNDAAFKFQHESVIVSPTHDFNFADLPKFYKEIVGTTKGMRTGQTIYVDYQVDEDVDTNTWIEAGEFSRSPKGTALINRGGMRLMRYRLRINTNNRLYTPVTKNIIVKGFARTPIKRQWNLKVVAERDSQRNTKALYDWLWKNCQEADGVIMHADLEEYNDVWVVVEPPNVIRESKQALEAMWTGYYTLTLREA